MEVGRRSPTVSRLGSIDRPADSDYNEILVGDRSFHIDRISFPGRFAGTDLSVLQIEFAFPVADTTRPLDAGHWKKVWLGELRRLGLVGEAHRVETFDLKHFRMHFNSFGAEGEPRREPDLSLIHRCTRTGSSRAQAREEKAKGAYAFHFSE